MITSRIYSYCSNSSLYFKSLKCHCCSFCFIFKKFTDTIQVCCLFHFIVDLSKEMQSVFKWPLKKMGGLWVGSNYINPD